MTATVLPPVPAAQVVHLGLPHPPSCPGGVILRSLLDHGRTRFRCSACGAQRIQEPATPAAAAVATIARAATTARRRALDATEPPAAKIDVIARGRHRCRAHPEQPVSWKGRGCPDCAADHRARRRAHTNQEHSYDD